MKAIIRTFLVSACVALTLLLVVLPSAIWATFTVPVFRGFRSYIDLGTPPALQLTNNEPFTVEAWVRVEYHRENEAVFFSKNEARTDACSYRFGLTKNGTKMGAYNGSAWREIALDEAVVLGAWHHLAFSFDGANMTCFFDGVSQGKLTYSFSDNASHTVKIGGYNYTTDWWGSLAEVRFWNYARDSIDVVGDMNRRLTGNEEGLLGYWPLDEGEGDQVTDRTAQAPDGTMIDAAWIVVNDFDLAAFKLAHPVTGSTRFTSTNEITVTSLSIPNDCDRYQFTLTGEVSAINPNGWISTNISPDYVSFDRPSTATNITVTAWFTNSHSTVSLRRDTASIYYTTVEPVLDVRSILTREQAPQSQTTIISGGDLDHGSTGGSVNGKELDIYAWMAQAVNPDDDLTAGEPYVTLPGTDQYALKLTVINEAGCAVTGEDVTIVTVSDYSGTNVWTGNGLTDRWSDGGNWNAGVPAAGQDVAVRLDTASVQLDAPTAELSSFSMTAGTLVFLDWNNCLLATNVQVIGGTVTTSGAFADFGPSNRVWMTAIQDFALASPGKINVSGKGYLPMMGPKKGVPGYYYGGGGGHGGRGGTSYVRGGGTYNSLANPQMAGSGGCYGSNFLGGNGGGAVRIEAGGTAVINGIIAANGVNGGRMGGGGAGGSIFITAARLTGTDKGQLQVNGGDESWVRYGAGGGGGRIAVTGGVIDEALAVRFSATPGKSTFDINDGKTLSECEIPIYLEPFQAWIPHWGTLYIEDDNFLAMYPTEIQLIDVILHVGNVREWSVEELTLVKNRFRLAPEGFALNVINNLSLGGTAHFGVEGSVFVGGDLLLDGTARLSIFAGPTNGNGSAYGAVVSVTNDVVIADSSWLQTHSNPTNGGSVLLRMRDLKVTGVEAGINATGRGFAGRWGPGRGAGTSVYGRGGGGGYGGKGAYGWYGSGVTYGNPYAPLLPGSGGGSGTDGAPYFAGTGYGGGLVHVEATEDVILNGQVVADGCAGWGSEIWAGGGSGGGVLISCHRFFGSETALLSARGGNNGRRGAGSGGGGRIAVWHARMPDPLQDRLRAGVTKTAIMSIDPPPAYVGKVDVSGGAGGTDEKYWGDAGTIWFIMPPPPGTVILLR